MKTNHKKRGRRKGKIQIALLHLLKEEEMHGYQMIKTLEERSKGYYVPSAGTIYPALQELLEKKLVEVRVEQDRKLYMINADGKQYLQELNINSELFWNRWQEKMIWKQTKECQEIQQQLGQWEKEIMKAEQYVAAHLDDAKELIDMITAARKQLTTWNEKHVSHTLE